MRRFGLGLGWQIPQVLQDCLGYARQVFEAVRHAVDAEAAAKAAVKAQNANDAAAAQQRAADALKAGRDLPAAKIFVCPVCGNLEIGAVPDKCPVCGLAGSKFQKAA